MVATATQEEVRTLHVTKEVDIAAPIEIAFEAILEELGPNGSMPDGSPMKMMIEPWPGGRWYRDLGNNTGHLWGHVQVIKPPKLLEICGPMFMSYAATNHVQYRLTANGDGTRLTLIHQGIGLITDEHREGVVSGWEHIAQQIRQIAEKNAKQRK